MGKWGKWTPSGLRLTCPNCGSYMQVPPNPKDKKEPEPKPPSQLAKVGGILMFDKQMPSVLIPASVRLRPVFRDSERRVICNAGLATIAVAIPAIVFAEAIAMYNSWSIGASVGIAATLSICITLPLAIMHYVIADEESKPVEPEQSAPEIEETEPEPVGDIAGWMTSERTDGGASFKFYTPPRNGNGRYISVRLVQRMAIEIVNAKGWLSERDMGKLGVPSGPYRLVRQDWLDRRWISAMPDKTTVINGAGRVMIGKIASTEPS